jgi:hypothetical protein
MRVPRMTTRRWMGTVLVSATCLTMLCKYRESSIYCSSLASQHRREAQLIHVRMLSSPGYLSVAMHTRMVRGDSVPVMKCAAEWEAPWEAQIQYHLSLASKYPRGPSMSHSGKRQPF